MCKCTKTRTRKRQHCRVSFSFWRLCLILSLNVCVYSYVYEPETTASECQSLCRARAARARPQGNREHVQFARAKSRHCLCLCVRPSASAADRSLRGDHRRSGGSALRTVALAPAALSASLRVRESASEPTRPTKSSLVTHALLVNSCVETFTFSKCQLRRLQSVRGDSSQSEGVHRSADRAFKSFKCPPAGALAQCRLWPAPGHGCCARQRTPAEAEGTCAECAACQVAGAAPLPPLIRCRFTSADAAAISSFGTA